MKIQVLQLCKNLEILLNLSVNIIFLMSYKDL